MDKSSCAIHSAWEWAPFKGKNKTAFAALSERNGSYGPMTVTIDGEMKLVYDQNIHIIVTEKNGEKMLGICF